METRTSPMGARSSSAQPLNPTVPLNDEMFPPGVSMIACIGFVVDQFATVKAEELTVRACPSLAIAVACTVWVPFGTVVVSKLNDQPTLGQPTPLGNT